MQLRYIPSVKIDQILNLIFEGGSIKGIAYLGAFKELLKQGLDFSKLQRIGGTSAGAITAVLLSIGCTVEELEKNLKSINFKDFLDEKSGNVRDALLNVKDSYLEGDYLRLILDVLDPNLEIGSSRVSFSDGLFDGDVIRKWIEDKLFEKTGYKHLTFAELHSLKEQYPGKYKDLYVVGINADTGYAQTFSYEDTPNVIISDAVRISMSIPFVYKTHQVHCKDENGKRIIDPRFKNYSFVDGGVTENYPLNLFDNTRYLPEDTQRKLAELGLYGKISNPNTLGFRLANKEKKSFYEGMNTVLTKQDANLLSKLISVLNNKKDSDHLRTDECSRTIYIDTCNVQTLDFNLTEEQKDLLCESGKQATKMYFDKAEIRANNNLHNVTNVFYDDVKRQPSALDEKIGIDHKKWAVAICTRSPKKQNNSFFASLFQEKEQEHVMMLVEGMNKYGKAVFKYYDLDITPSYPSVGYILNGKIKADSALVDRNNYLKNDIYQKSNLTTIKAWPISKTQAKLLDHAIREDKDKSTGGCLNFKTTSKTSSEKLVERNRFSWFQEKLLQLGKETNDTQFEQELKKISSKF